jgi:hypothetical protein
MEWATPERPERKDGLFTYSVMAKNSAGYDEFVVIAANQEIANKLAIEEHIRRNGIPPDSVELTQRS